MAYSWRSKDTISLDIVCTSNVVSRPLVSNEGKRRAGRIPEVSNAVAPSVADYITLLPRRG